MTTIEAWPEQEAADLAARARRVFYDHDCTGHRSDPLVRANCGACCLNGYREPRSHFSKYAGPNYAGWARLYVQTRRPIPANWRDVFELERLSNNKLYALALERDIATFGVRFEED